jgi:hypothetical protein
MIKKEKNTAKKNVETIEKIDAESSIILSLEYNKKTFELDVVFKNGKEYKYYNVPLNVWSAFKDSSSKGSFYSKVIKGRYGNTEHKI